MAAPADSGGKDEVKTQFVTREGTYRLMALSEYSRPNRVGYTSAGGGGAGPVRVSLVTLPPPPPPTPPAAARGPEDDAHERICFNHGKELYVYVYRGIKKAADLTKPVDKKMYKGTNPTCHDFNSATATHDSASLLIGFSTGQIQLIDPIKKEISKLFNEERVVDKSRVTCIRWVPGGGGGQFVAAHATGALYAYDAALPCPTAAPLYARHVHGAGYTVCNNRSRSPRNPTRRWCLGGGACINEFAWSPCGTRLATAGQDGFLRVFEYATTALVGRARSYFGGLLCVSWSADGRVVAVGGEDDLVTLWGVGQRRVLARLQGHRSWVSAVAFDRHVTGGGGYRLGSVAQDTQLCLWDVAQDALQPPRGRAPVSPAAPHPVAPPPAPPTAAGKEEGGVNGTLPARTKRDDNVAAFTARLTGFSFGDRRSTSATGRHGRAARDGGAGTGGGVCAAAGGGDADDAEAAVGTALCPRFDDVPVLEPLVVKKIAHERLTALHFLPDCIVTACADGCVNTWARPPCRASPPAPTNGAHSRPPSE